MTTKDYADAYMSLHLIELVLWVVRCDCKAFWHSLVCKHLLAAEVLCRCETCGPR